MSNIHYISQVESQTNLLIHKLVNPHDYVSTLLRRMSKIEKHIEFSIPIGDLDNQVVKGSVPQVLEIRFPTCQFK